MVPGLLTLDLSYCEDVTETGVAWLAERVTTLMNLNVYKCSLPGSALSGLQESWSYVTIKNSDEFFGLVPQDRAADRRFIEEYGVCWIAAVKMQGIYRAKKAREELAKKRELHLMNWVVTRFQAVYRTRQAKRFFIIKKLMAKRDADAARMLQCAYRMRRARRLLAKQKKDKKDTDILKYAIMVQKRYRGKVAKNLFMLMKIKQRDNIRKAHEAAKRVQRIWRGREARANFELFKLAQEALRLEKIKAASDLQRMMRGRRARTLAMNKRKLLLEEDVRREIAAAYLQRVYRGRLGRVRHLQRILLIAQQHKAAKYLQKLWRARASKNILEILRAAKLLKAMEAGALVVQGAWRRRQGRFAAYVLARAREAERKLKTKMAMRVQRNWRGRMARAVMKLLLSKKKRAGMAQEALLNWAAMMVQAGYRGNRGRNVAKQVKIQAGDHWKTLFDQDEQKHFFYHKGTGEIRWRMPQAMLERLPKPTCDNCERFHAHMECKTCEEMYCTSCYMQIHFGGKRRTHTFRALYDYWGKRVDYGDGEFPAVWPSEINQDEFHGWGMRVPDEPESDEELTEDGYETPRQTDTQQSTYVRPPFFHTPRMDESDWKKYFDEETGKVFYFNQVTKQSTFNRPHGFVTPRKLQNDDTSSSDDGGGSIEWEKYLDDTETVYYWNNVTEESTYTRPKHFRTPRDINTNTDEKMNEQNIKDWEKYNDGDDNIPYYYNIISGESKYERPVGYDTTRANEEKKKRENNNTNDSLNNPNPTTSVDPNNFEKYKDEDGVDYFYNINTGDSTYERPSGFVTKRENHCMFSSLNCIRNCIQNVSMIFFQFFFRTKICT
eukprot:GSMAST32.ASY1.ANO1.1276.1 assembled CDS